MIALADLLFALLGIVLIGVGIWWHDPGASLAVVGFVVLLLSVLSRLIKQPQND